MALALRTHVMQLLHQPGITQVVFIARELSKAYRMGDVEVHALRSVNLDLYEGELVVLLGEIGFMLLGEQAVLTIIAIPVGFAFGYGIAGLITVAIEAPA